MISTGEGIEKMEAKKLTNLTKGNKTSMLNESIPQLWINSGRYRTVINPLMNRTQGEIKSIFLYNIIT